MHERSNRLVGLVRTLAVVIAAAGLGVFSPVWGGNEGFVSAHGTAFRLNGTPFYYAGTNTYYLMVYAADAGLRGYVDEVLTEASAMGLRVLRTWAFNDGASQWNALQTAPGVYQEAVFQGLDYVLNKADEVGVRLILPFVNNWDDYGGMNQYVTWDGTYGDGSASSHDDFYTDADIKGWYKNHISTVLNRVNTLNGRTYKNDPTIFAWELGNEPRCASDPTGTTLNAWMEEISTYIQSLDGNHLVTTGIEGFYNTGNPIGWMNNQGTDFIANHQISSVDFAVAHSWPDHWGWGGNYTATMAFVQQQITDAHTVIGKPFVLEEFGKCRDGGGGTATRDQFFQGYYDLIYSMRAGGGLFWILYHDDYPDYDGFGVYYPADTSTIAIIEAAAARESSLPVKLSSFTASSKNGVVTLHWITESEVDNLGFHIYRALSERGPYEKITAERIQGAGSSASKHEYTFTDEGLTEGVTYWYRLEDVAFDGTRTMHGPISVTLKETDVTLEQTDVPVAYALRTYPNPFNASTTIRYQLSEPGPVRLLVYDLLGRTVKVLVDGRMEAGYHSVVWDGTDNSGRPVRSGMYLVRMEAGEVVKVRKMMLIQ